MLLLAYQLPSQGKLELEPHTALSGWSQWCDFICDEGRQFLSVGKNLEPEKLKELCQLLCGHARVCSKSVPPQSCECIAAEGHQESCDFNQSHHRPNSSLRQPQSLQ